MIEWDLRLRSASLQSNVMACARLASGWHRDPGDKDERGKCNVRDNAVSFFSMLWPFFLGDLGRSGRRNQRRWSSLRLSAQIEHDAGADEHGNGHGQ
jgi:hypothetical protein